MLLSRCPNTSEACFCLSPALYTKWEVPRVTPLFGQPASVHIGSGYVLLATTQLQSMDADLLDFNPYLLNSALGLHIDAPTAYVDGWVLPNHPSQRIQAGQVNVKRVIVGANSMDSPLARRSWLNHRRYVETPVGEL